MIRKNFIEELLQKVESLALEHTTSVYSEGSGFKFTHTYCLESGCVITVKAYLDKKCPEEISISQALLSKELKFKFKEENGTQSVAISYRAPLQRGLFDHLIKTKNVDFDVTYEVENGEWGVETESYGFNSLLPNNLYLDAVTFTSYDGEVQEVTVKNLESEYRDALNKSFSNVGDILGKLAIIEKGKFKIFDLMDHLASPFKKGNPKPQSLTLRK